MGRSRRVGPIRQAYRITKFNDAVKGTEASGTCVLSVDANEST